MELKGIEMPMIGLGTWNSLGNVARSSVKTALDVGYRHIDTAFLYENETVIGKVLQEYFSSGKLKREEVFITSKLWLTHMGKQDVRPAFEESLRRLQLDYLDLYLIHAPFGLKNTGNWNLFPRDKDEKLALANYDIIETWNVLEELVAEKRIRYIGLSNFNSEQVEKICKYAKSVKPYTNQVECHAYFQQKELLEFCKVRDITLTAFAPLGSPGRKNIDDGSDEDEMKVLDDLVVKRLAAKYKKTPAQIMLRNLIQRDIRVIPKSSNPTRIKENFDVSDFHLNDEDMDAIANIETVNRFFTFDSTAPHMVDHPEYPFNIPF